MVKMGKWRWRDAKFLEQHRIGSVEHTIHGAMLTSFNPDGRRALTILRTAPGVGLLRESEAGGQLLVSEEVAQEETAA